MKEMIFVYNADSGLFNTMADFIHKIISPSTYTCHLCALTYGNFTEKEEWKDFVRQLPFESVFLHRNEFKKEYQVAIQLPAIFIKENASLHLLVSQTELDCCTTLQQLQQLITTKLSLYDKHHHTYL